MKIKRINIIGFGNVGQSLAQHLCDHVEIASIFTRSKNQYSSQYPDKEFVSNITDLKKDVDLNLVAVTDSAISEVIKLLDKTTPIVHTSGGISKDILSSFSNYGIIYPLQTFSTGVVVKMANVPIFIEGSSEDFAKAIDSFVWDNISKKIFRANSDHRRSLHISAIITSNFLTYFMGVADDLLKNTDIPTSVLEPLISETLRKTLKIGASQALTGPAIRGDKTLLESYEKDLQDSDFKLIFNLVNKKMGAKDFTAL